MTRIEAGKSQLACLFALDPERAHGLALAGLKGLSRRPAAPGGPLETTVAGLTFPNPLGMAAGFDKDGEVPDALLGQGFGFVEVGFEEEAAVF